MQIQLLSLLAIKPKITQDMWNEDVHIIIQSV